MKIDFTVTEGRMPRGYALQVAEYLRGLEGRRMTLTVEEAKKYSSDPQRKYYFGVLIPGICEVFYNHGTLLSKEESHEWAKRHIGKLTKNVVTPDGEVTEILRSYRDLDTMEVEIYHTNCRAWAAQHGVDIPEPNEPTDFIDEVTGGKEPQLMG